MATTTRDKVFDAISGGYDGVISVLEATEARTHALSEVALAEARSAQKEAIAVVRKWVDAPANLYENVEAVIDAQAHAQHRVLELARDGVGGAREYGADMRDAVRRIIRANRDASEATVMTARKAYRLVRREGDNAARTQAKPTRVPVKAAEGSGGNAARAS